MTEGVVVGQAIGRAFHRDAAEIEKAARHYADEVLPG